MPYYAIIIIIFVTCESYHQVLIKTMFFLLVGNPEKWAWCCWIREKWGLQQRLQLQSTETFTALCYLGLDSDSELHWVLNSKSLCGSDAAAQLWASISVVWQKHKVVTRLWLLFSCFAGVQQIFVSPLYSLGFLCVSSMTWSCGWSQIEAERFILTPAQLS